MILLIKPCKKFKRYDDMISVDLDVGKFNTIIHTNDQNEKLSITSIDIIVDILTFQRQLLSYLCLNKVTTYSTVK